MNDETALQQAIQTSLSKLGFWVERTNAGQTGGVRHLPAGTPDLLILAPCYGWLEVKRPGEDLNDNQRRWHHRARRCGIPVAVVRSVREAVGVAIGWKSQNPLGKPC